MSIKFNYNDTFSSAKSQDDVDFDFASTNNTLPTIINKDEVETLLKGAPVVKNSTVNANDAISSGLKQDVIVNIEPKEDPYATAHTRHFYRGKSFRYAGVWKAGVHYLSDEYITDFVTKDNVLLVCTKNHMSSSANEPKDWLEHEGVPYGIISDYWDLVLSGRSGSDGDVYLPSYDSENDRLVWNLVSSEDLESPIYVALGLNARINDAINPIKSDIGSLNLITTHISSNLESLQNRVTDAEGNIGQLTLDAKAFDVRMSDAEGNIGQLTLTAREFSVEMSNLQGDVGRLWLTAQEFGVRMSNAEGDVSLLQMTADEIQTRVENAEGDISQIHQRADEIWSQVENNQGDISRISQKADEISTQVTNAEGDISQLKQTATEISTRVENNEGDISRISQRADVIESTVENAQGDISQIRQTAIEISSTVAANKELADGAIAENRSLISQTAEEIRSEVESNVTRLDGAVEQNRSEIRQTAEEITSTVERNKRAVDGSISELNSTITQTAEEIRAEVSRVETDVNGSIEDAKSEMKQTADEISATVARNKAESDGSFQSVSAQLSVQADQIQSNVDSIESVEDRVTTSESNITQLSNEISTKVSQTEFNTKTQQIESSVSTIDQKANNISLSVSTLSGTVDNNAREFSNYVTDTDAELLEIQRQLDGAIVSWFYEGVPTLNNEPASNWRTTEDKNVHLGDLYYDKNTGFAYRFVLDGSVYKWIQIEDDAVAKALADAARAQDTADNKRRIFIEQPTPPYDAGDLWVQGHTSNNDGAIFRCIHGRQGGTFISSDWELASDYTNTKKVKSAFEIFADGIQMGTWQESYDGTLVPQSLYTSIKTAIDNISFTVGKVGSALLPTGINIADQYIKITANNFKLVGNDPNSTEYALEMTYDSNGVPRIKAKHLEVEGVFSTSAWDTAKNGILSTAATNAETYITNNVAPLIRNAQTTANNAQSAVNGLGYLANALNNGTTAIGGGLVLTSLIGLGGNSGTNDEWELWSGMNGQYSASAPGYGVGAWYGGGGDSNGNYIDCTTIPNWATMTTAQRLAAWDTYRYARSLFRLDGSGYLASGAITWGAAGDLHLLDNVYIGPDMNKTLSDISTFVTLLSTWFEDDEIEINGVSKHVLRINMSGDTHDTGFAGVVWNGFLITGGDQILGSGTSGGGGGGTGGAGYLYELGDVYSVNNAVARADGSAKQVGDVLQYLNSTKGWVAVAASSIGRIYSAGTGLNISNSNVISIATGYKLPTTTEWGNKADASALGNYLPLSAGSSYPLTGELYTSSPISMVGVSNRKFQIALTSSFGLNNANVDVGWNWENRDGAGAAFRSVVDNEVESGAIRLFARNSTNCAQIRFWADGTFQIQPSQSAETWYDVLHSGNFIAGTGISISNNTVSNSGVRTATINGNYLRVNTNGTNADLTIPFATVTRRFYNVDATSAGLDLNTALTGGAAAYNYSSGNYWQNGPSGMTYGGVLQINSHGASDALAIQLAWDINHNVADGTKNLWWRDRNNLGWGDWRQIYHSGNFNPGNYLPLSAGSSYPLTNTLYITLSATSTTPNIVAKAGTSNVSYLDIRTSDNKSTNIGFISGSGWGVPDYGGAYLFTTSSGHAGGIFVSGDGVYYSNTSNDLDKYTVYHSGNLSFSNGLSLSSGTVSNSGVRSATINGNYLKINTNGTDANLTIPYALRFGAADYRNSYPSAFMDGDQGRLVFLSGSICGIGSGYVDALVLNSWHDTTGGNTNAILMRKNDSNVWHTQFAYGSSDSWGTPVKFLDTGNFIADTNYLTPSTASNTYVAKAGDRMSGILLMASGGLTVTGGATRIQTAESVNDVVWPVALKNYYHATGTSGVVGVGLKLSLGYLTEGGKWAGIAAMSESDNENNVGMRFYVGANNSISTKMSLYHDGSLDLHNGNLSLSAGNIFLSNGGTSGNRTFGIKRTNSNKNIDIGWDWDAGDGAGAFFKSADDTSGGSVGFFARNSTSVQRTLTGSVAGDLTWTGRFVAKEYQNNSWNTVLGGFAASLGAGKHVVIKYGKADTKYNCGALQYYHVGDGSTSNMVALGFNGIDYQLAIRADGTVHIGYSATTGGTQKLNVNGNILSTGDQVISSDINLKKNIKDLDLTVEQIAQLPAVTFDWKDGRGSTFGTVAQGVLPIFPQAVRGNEGNYSVVYGQGGWVFGVKNARAIVDIQAHETEQDKEIKKLKARVRDVEKQLKIS